MMSIRSPRTEAGGPVDPLRIALEGCNHAVAEHLPEEGHIDMIEKDTVQQLKSKNKMRSATTALTPQLHRTFCHGDGLPELSKASSQIGHMLTHCWS